MTSTLWFWIVLILLVLIIFFWMRKYLGRLILILLFFFVLFFIYKWLSPVGAKNVFLAIKAFPVQITNIINQKILKNSITLTLPGLEQNAPLSGNIQDEPNPQLSGVVIEIEEATNTQNSLSGVVIETEETLLEQENQGVVEEETEEDEVYYLPSNPKTTKKTEPSASSSLSSNDLKEAREIF